MRLLSESRTDEEYVEGVRAWLANRHGAFRRHMVLFLLLVVLGIVWPSLVMAGVARAIVSDTNPRLDIAILLTYKAGLSLPLGVFSLVWARRVFHGPRLERLMIRYYDGLGEEGDEAQICTETAEDEWPGFAEGSLRSKTVRWMFRRDFALKARTDQECVALARNLVRRQRRWSLVFVPLAAVQVTLFWLWLRFARSDVLGFSGTTPWTALTTGVALGVVGGLLLCYAIDYFVEARESLRHPRIARLLLRYHDATMSASRAR